MSFSCLMNLSSAKNTQVYLIIEQEKISEHYQDTLINVSPFYILSYNKKNYLNISGDKSI